VGKTAKTAVYQILYIFAFTLNNNTFLQLKFLFIPLVKSLLYSK